MNLSRRQWMLSSVVGLLGANTVSSAAPKWNIPGGVAEVRWRKQSNAIPEVKFGLAQPVIIDAGNYWRVLIGLSLDTLPGQYLVYVKSAESEEPAFTLQFEVLQKRFPLIAAKQADQLSTLNTKRLSELDFINSVPPSLPLRLPVDAAWQDDFGQLFVTDGAAAGQKNFLDLIAPENSTQVVQAPQNGIISRVQPNTDGSEQNDGGATICIDHGRGLFSVLYGVVDLTIELGNGVVAGAVIGKMKAPSQLSSDTTSAIASTVLTATGVASGTSASDYSLRWQCVLNGVYVNPLILTQIS